MLGLKGLRPLQPAGLHAVPLLTLPLSLLLSLFLPLSFSIFRCVQTKNAASFCCCNPRRRHFTSQFSYNVDCASRFIATSKYSIIFICLYLVFPALGFNECWGHFHIFKLFSFMNWIFSYFHIHNFAANWEICITNCILIRLLVNAVCFCITNLEILQFVEDFYWFSMILYVPNLR